jgi:chromate reductase
MSQVKVAVVVGSLRKDSLNLKLAHALVALAPKDWSFDFLKIDDLPLYNQDLDANFPAPATRLKQQVEAAQALLFVTPEYNRSIPGVLKNAIDWASRPWGKNSWGGKPSGVVGISVGAIGTALAQQHLRNVLSYLDVESLGQPEMFLQAKEGFFDADGKVSNPDTVKFLQAYVDRYVSFVSKHVGMGHSH